MKMMKYKGSVKSSVPVRAVGGVEKLAKKLKFKM